MSTSAMLLLTLAFTVFGLLVSFGASAFLDIEALLAGAIRQRHETSMKS